MDWEFNILNHIQRNIRNDTLDKIMPLLSPMYVLGGIMLLVVIVTFFIKKTRNFCRSLTITLITGLIPCNLIFKPIVARLRPYQLNTNIKLLVAPEIDASFPSGHTFFSFAFATVCFLYNKKLGIAMYILAFIMAFSRLYLYVHFPTDVIFGALLGVLTAVIVCRCENMFLKKML